MKPLGVLVAAVALTATAALSRGRLRAFERTDAMVRVAWSARPARVEVCKRVSDEELATLPAHMRRQVVCEGTTARYRLDVALNGAPMRADTIRGGGLRHDREVYVFRELMVSPGRTTVVVRFTQIDSSGVDAVDAPANRSDGRIEEQHGLPNREADERRRQRAQAIAAELVLDTVITLAPRGVVLVTYDDRRRMLVATSGTP